MTWGLLPGKMMGSEKRCGDGCKYAFPWLNGLSVPFCLIAIDYVSLLERGAFTKGILFSIQLI